jgi:hypothetical protein
LVLPCETIAGTKRIRATIELFQLGGSLLPVHSENDNLE